MIDPVLALSTPSLPDPFLTAVVVAVLVRANALPFSGRIMDAFFKAKEQLEGKSWLSLRQDRAGQAGGGMTIYLAIFAAALAFLACTALGHRGH